MKKNLEKQVEAASAWEREHAKQLADLIPKIEALGGRVFMVHDEITVEFHEDTPTEAQNEIFRLLQESTMPKFDDLKLEPPDEK